jgi:hypothetical protein
MTVEPASELVPVTTPPRSTRSERTPELDPGGERPARDGGRRGAAHGTGRGRPPPSEIARRLARVVVTFAVVVFALIGLLSVTRGTPIEHVGVLGARGDFPAIGTPAFVQAVGLYADAPLTPGNHVEVLTDGDGAYPLDFPQPDGPMGPVTPRGGTSSVTRFSAWNAPYHRSRSRTTTAGAGESTHRPGVALASAGGSGSVPVIRSVR